MAGVNDRAWALYQMYRNRVKIRYERDLASGSEPLTLDEIADALGRLGIRPGDRVMVHSQSAVLGQVEGGLFGVIRLLQDQVGPRGTLMMPTYPSRTSTWENRFLADKLFDVRRTPSQMGLLTELFRRAKGVHRSLHPTHSTAVWGADAEEWATGHADDPSPFHPGSPFGRLHEAGGKVVFLELDGLHLTQAHVAEDILWERFPSRICIPDPCRMRVRDRKKREWRVPSLLHDPRQSSLLDPRWLYPKLEKRGVVRRFWLRNYIPFVMVEARPFVDELIRLATTRGRTLYTRTTTYGLIRAASVVRKSTAPRATRFFPAMRTAHGILPPGAVE